MKIMVALALFVLFSGADAQSHHEVSQYLYICEHTWFLLSYFPPNFIKSDALAFS